MIHNVSASFSQSNMQKNPKLKFGEKLTGLVDSPEYNVAFEVACQRAVDEGWSKVKTGTKKEKGGVEKWYVTGYPPKNKSPNAPLSRFA